jgi:PIN domain nuclease of toxin-antitoxin system
LPLTVDIAREVMALQSVLRDPVDSVIVATARVHGLRLLTSNQRILDSRLVSTID